MEYRVIDADGHILEPPNLWEQYIEPKYREACPKLMTYEDSEIFRIEGEASSFGARQETGEIRRLGHNWGTVR